VKMIKSKEFWVGAAAGVLIWQLLLPRFAPGLRAKLPL